MKHPLSQRKPGSPYSPPRHRRKSPLWSIRFLSVFLVVVASLFMFTVTFLTSSLASFHEESLLGHTQPQHVASNQMKAASNGKGRRNTKKVGSLPRTDAAPVSPASSIAKAVSSHSEAEGGRMTDQKNDSPSKALSKNRPSSDKYAYAFVIGGIHESKPAYKGFLFNVLISVSLLRKYGSKADFWLYAQLSPKSQLHSLPPDDMRLLSALNIHIELLEKPAEETFLNIVFEKFRPLQMVQYRKVMFLDADAIPLVNLDYLFHRTDLRPNLIMASKGEPCNAGMFILEPADGAWEQLRQIIEDQREAGKLLPHPHFDWDHGWGHNFTAEGDQWNSIEKYGVRWRFHAGHSDQGLLYYYMKYVRQDVSIVIGNRTENWIPGQDGKPELHEEMPNVVDGKSPEPVETQFNCAFPERRHFQEEAHMCLPVYRDFAHFMGSSKPWQIGVHPPWGPNDYNARYAPYRLWFKELTLLNDRLEIGIDIENFDEVHLPQLKESPLGYMAQFVQYGDPNPKVETDACARIFLPQDEPQNSPSLASMLKDAKSTLRHAYAYAFLLDGIHENKLAYKGFLYGILNAVSILRKSGSTADFWVYAQLSPFSSLVSLPDEDTRLLSALDIQVELLAMPQHVEDIVYEKFRILQMTQYRRVMFLSSDVVPLLNLDYLFLLSDAQGEASILRPNIVIASKGEPCGTSMFILQPEQGAWERIQQLVADIRKGPFDFKIGWGHAFIEEGDFWESIVKKDGDKWRFNGANTDRGLLYYYVKYIKKNVSIIIGTLIQNWIPGKSGKPEKVHEFQHGLDESSPQPKVTQYNCGLLDRRADQSFRHMCLPVYRDIAVLPASHRPWEIGLHPPWGPKDCNKNYAPYRLWFKELIELNENYDMNLAMERWDEVHLPQFKEYPSRESPSTPAPGKATEGTLWHGPSLAGFLPDRFNKSFVSWDGHAKYAYAWVIGAIHEDRPAYKGFLYDVLISVNLLQKFGSQADFWLYTQLSPDSELQELPVEDMRLLSALNIHVEQLQKPTVESFAQLVFEKFRPLQLTQYRRVMFLDADTIPLLDFDYLFHLSDPDYYAPNVSLPLRPNLIMASKGEPCNAGMFILEPVEGSWEQLQQVIRDQRHAAMDLPHPHFDWEVGWGHNFTAEGDFWESIDKSGDRWRFHAGHSDQGLLYFFLKYVKQDVSIVIGNRIQNWMSGGKSGKPQLVKEFPNLIDKYAVEPNATQNNCGKQRIDEAYKHMCLPVYRDFAHFMGNTKPWQVGVHPKWGIYDCHKTYEPYRLWWKEIGELNEKLMMNINISDWDESHLPQLKDSPLGYIAMFADSTVLSEHADERQFRTKTDQMIDPNFKAVQELLGGSDLQSLEGSSVKTAIPDPSHRYAYAWVIGGIREDMPGYKGFLYDVLISVSLLRKFGSTSDFWLWIQLSPNSKLETLPEEDLRLLSTLDVHVVQLDKPQEESFADLVFEKFRPLQLTQYRRVIFLDSDTIPLVNLDYLFHRSDPDHGQSTTLLSNLIIASHGEPCNAGMFMMKPYDGAWERLQRIIQQQRSTGKLLPYPHFDWDIGWGHNFTAEGDQWDSVAKFGTRWRFHAGHSDQGLLYYFVKYVEQDVSIVIGDRIENWGPGEQGKPSKLMTIPNKVDENSPIPAATQYNCGLKNKVQDEYFYYMCFPIYRDFAHFMGKNKPWQVGIHPPFGLFDDNKFYAPYRLWWRELNFLNVKLSMGLDLYRWDDVFLPQLRESPLGYMAMFKSTARNKAVQSRKADSTSLIAEPRQASPIESYFLRLKNGDREAPPPRPVLSGDGSYLTIAYAVSFIKCGDFQTNSAGLIDASLVLRHSIHKISRRNRKSGSKYDYKMYAIVHRQAEACSSILNQTGFEVIIVDPPVLQREIIGEYLNKKIHREWCCGADEFIKLYAYALPEDIIVHVDIDFAFYKPLDNLFDAILHKKDSVTGQAARKKIDLERPTEQLPENIHAFITRDWAQVAPRKFPPAYQAGFLVARRDPSVFTELVDTIKKGNYTDGWGWNHGWGGKGYGGYVGAMAMQGVIAYYYDHLRPNTAVELNQCRYNHMGMDVRYRKMPNFNKKNPGVGGCRNGLAYCEDCMTTDFANIYCVHYTMCRKPWQCQATGLPGGKKPGGERATAINTDTVNLDHCLELVHQWHDLRKDLEDQLFALSKDESIRNGTKGSYRVDVFNGHCKGDGNDNYLLLAGSSETFRRIHELYK